MPLPGNVYRNLVNAGREAQVWKFWPHWVQCCRWWPPTHGDDSWSSSQSRKSFNGRSTAKRCPRRQWMVKNGRGQGEEQILASCVTKNWWNRWRWKRVKPRVFKLPSSVFRLVYYGEDGRGTKVWNSNYATQKGVNWDIKNYSILKQNAMQI